ncbi:MAG: hypothetical protein H6508_06555 [Calditrichaeota bacterium]|nr:hypothetical protein [Calditrichota bacterium]
MNIEPQESTESQQEREGTRQRRILWWFLAMVCTIGGVAAPFMLTDQAGTIAWAMAIVLAGAVLGLLNSQRPWLYPVMLALGYALVGLLLGGFESWKALLIRLQLGATLAIPAAIGSYAGAVIRKLVRGRMQWTGAETPRAARWAATAMGMCSAVIFVKLPGQNGLILSCALLLLSALYLGYHYSDRLWRWVVLLGFGIPLVALMRTALELYYYPEANGLFPIELSLAVAVAVFPSLLGSMVGRALHRYKLRTS